MNNFKHSTRKHARLSASGSSRWINCTPSAKMEEGMNLPDASTTYADEGTLAHEFADLELRIRSYNGAGTEYDKCLKEKETLKSHKLYDPEMHTHVDTYVAYVLEALAEAKKTNPDAELLIEERINFSHLVPEGFGTGDAAIVSDGILQVIDLKYGKGVRVEAKKNSQMRLYGSGLAHAYDLFYDIKTVRMTIVQPRLDYIDTEEISLQELIDWGKKVVAPAAKKANKGDGVCKPGDWCKWCKAKPVCRALADYNLKLAKKDFADPNLLTDEELIEVLEQAGLLSDWVSAVRQHVLQEALKGKSFSGYKLVEGKSSRRWANEAEALATLKKKKYRLEQIINTKIKGVGDIEKLIGKEKFEKLKLTVKPAGKPTLVPESDKRIALNSYEQAKEEFGE